MRPLVSYDDITPAYEPPEDRPQGPPTKKRKETHQKSKRGPHKQNRGREVASHSGGRDEYQDMDGYEEDEDESRELTHQELWDDSSLIDAWNAAAEEYEAFHGPEKGWKNEPVHKSPLWYNVPPSPSKKRPHASLSATPVETAGDDTEAVDAEQDSHPLNFDTFVPSHDPTLDLPSFAHPASVPGPDYASHYLPHPPGEPVSQDEAFNRALGAMYWGGYWTAVYHYQSQHNAGANAIAEAEASSDEIIVTDMQEVEAEAELEAKHE